MFDRERGCHERAYFRGSSIVIRSCILTLHDSWTSSSSPSTSSFLLSVIHGEGCMQTMASASLSTLTAPPGDYYSRLKTVPMDLYAIFTTGYLFLPQEPINDCFFHTRNYGSGMDTPP